MSWWRPKPQPQEDILKSFSPSWATARLVKTKLEVRDDGSLKVTSWRKCALTGITVKIVEHI